MTKLAGKTAALLLLAACLLCSLLLASCELRSTAGKSGAGTQASKPGGGHSSASSAAGSSTPPAQSPFSNTGNNSSTITQDVLDSLPIDGTYSITTYHEGNGEVHLTAKAPSGGMETAGAVLQRLSALGYDSAENPSEILQGTEYTSTTARYKRLYIKVTVGTDDECGVQLDGYPS